MLQKHLLALILLFCASQLSVLARDHKGLVIFLGPESHPVTKDFIDNYLPKIDSLAKAQGMDLEIRNVEAGSPEMISFTPAIVYQNFRGRSLYIGRYHYLDKLNTFIRTVKRLPQQRVDNEKHDVLVWKNGKAVVYTPAKITDLKGCLPPNFDQEKFKKDALKALSKGSQNYKLLSQFNAERSHRAMYMAYYPFLGEDEKLWISAEMYSQFNCIKPIFRRFEKPFEGNWDDWKGAFSLAAAEMEQEMIRQLRSIENGDGMVAVAKNNPIKSWAELNLDLPPKPAGPDLAAVDPNMKLPSKWIVDGPVSADIPLLNFHFLAPLDYYAGEITDLSGQLDLAPGGKISDLALGKFTVKGESLTMGDESLDHSIHGMILIADYPEASFTFKKMNFVEQEKLAFGMMTQFSVQGELDFLGIKAPINVAAQIEPILNENGEARLQVYATFDLQLKDRYDLDGPDGPEPANDTMKFYLNFLLKGK